MSNQKVPTTTAKAWIVEVDLEATGEQLRRKRQEHHLTQEMLSEIFDAVRDPASRVAISRWENGRKLPSFSHFGFLKKLYGCTLDELVVFSCRLADGEDDQPVPLIKYLMRRIYVSIAYVRLLLSFSSQSFTWHCAMLCAEVVDMSADNNAFVPREKAIRCYGKIESLIRSNIIAQLKMYPGNSTVLLHHSLIRQIENETIASLTAKMEEAAAAGKHISLNPDEIQTILDYHLNPTSSYWIDPIQYVLERFEQDAIDDCSESTFLVSHQLLGNGRSIQVEVSPWFIENVVGFSDFDFSDDDSFITE